jgi:hypothetical protein
VDADPTIDPARAVDAAGDAAAARTDTSAGPEATDGVEPQGEPVATDDLDVPDDWSERTDDDPAAVAEMRAERASRRMRQTVRDMVISMLVVSGAVLLLVFPWNRSQPDPVRVIDPTPVITGARATEPWPVLAPVGLASTWRCTSARITTAGDGQDVVHLGYVTPGTTYVGLEQSATKELTFVAEQTVGGSPTGSATLAGVTWQKYESTDGKHVSYVRRADGATYVATGSDWAELTTFTTSLVAG